MKMSEEKKVELQAKRWSDNKSKSIDHEWYAIQRMDLLTISISGALIYMSLEIFKHISYNKLEVDTCLMKISAVFAVLSIVINFVSQYFGYEANSKDAVYNNKKLLKTIGEIDDYNFELLDSKIQTLNSLVKSSNIASMSLMFLSICFMTIFCLISF